MADTSSGGYLYEGERKWRKSHIDILICGLFHRKYLGVQAIRGLGNHDAHFHMMSSTEIWAVVDKVKRDSELKETIFNHWLATSPYDKTVLDNVVKMKLEDRGQIVAGIAKRLGDNVNAKLRELSVQKSNQDPIYTKVVLTQEQQLTLPQEEQDRYVNERNAQEEEEYSWPKGPC